MLKVIPILIYLMVVLNLFTYILKALYILLFVLFPYEQHFISTHTKFGCDRNKVVNKYFEKNSLSGSFLQKHLNFSETCN